MATPAQKKWISTIHLAKNKTGIDEASYRAILSGCAGVQSAKEIETWEQYNKIMLAFMKLGFTLTRKAESDNRNPEWISAKQESYIRHLWRLSSRQKDDESLEHFVKRITGAEKLIWLKKKDAQKVILALRQMTLDAGISLDKKD